MKNIFSIGTKKKKNLMTNSKIFTKKFILQKNVLNKLLLMKIFLY